MKISAGFSVPGTKQKSIFLSRPCVRMLNSQMVGIRRDLASARALRPLVSWSPYFGVGRSEDYVGPKVLGRRQEIGWKVGNHKAGKTEDIKEVL